MNEPISNVMNSTDVKDDIKAVIKAEVNAEFDNFVLEHLDNVRSTIIDGVEWYVGADVSKELRLDSLGSHLVYINDKDKRLISADERISLGIISKNNYKGKLYLINENGLKVLVLRKCATKKKYEIVKKCEMLKNKNKRDSSSSQYDNITHDFGKDNIHMNNNSLDFTAFSNDEFGRIRIVMIDGEVWFVGKDVTEALGYSNSRKALADHVDDEDKTDGVTIRDTMGREQLPVLINESGLYSLIMSSKLTTAKKFKRWVTSEVLPALHKNGYYINPVVASKKESPLNNGEITELHQTMRELIESNKAMKAIIQNRFTFDEYSANIWKKNFASPKMQQVADAMGITKDDAREQIYDYMNSCYGFCKASSLQKFTSKYGESKSVLDVIADEYFLQARFFVAADALIDLAKENKEIDVADKENIENQNNDIDSVVNNTVNSIDNISDSKIALDLNDNFEVVIRKCSK